MAVARNRRSFRSRHDASGFWHSGDHAVTAAAILTLGQWLVCIGVAATLIVVDEVITFFLRRNRRTAEHRSSAATPTVAGGPTEYDPAVIPVG